MGETLTSLKGMPRTGIMIREEEVTSNEPDRRMVGNKFIPGGLQSLNDHALVRTFIDYRHAYQMLRRSATAYTAGVRTQLEEALSRIEHEMRLRGLQHYLTQTI